MKTVGIIRTALGDYHIFPCGCDKDLMPHNQYKAVRFSDLKDGTYPTPINVTFETDYIYEENIAEIRIRE